MIHFLINSCQLLLVWCCFSSYQDRCRLVTLRTHPYLFIMLPQWGNQATDNILLSHIILTPRKPGLVLSKWCQEPCQEATSINFKAIGSNPRNSDSLISQKGDGRSTHSVIAFSLREMGVSNYDSPFGSQNEGLNIQIQSIIYLYTSLR